MFTPVAPPSGGATPLSPAAVTGEDGSFRLMSFKPGDGAPAGDYQVTIIYPMDRFNKHLSGIDRLKGKFANPKTSGLAAKVEPKNNEQPFTGRGSRGAPRPSSLCASCPGQPAWHSSRQPHAGLAAVRRPRRPVSTSHPSDQPDGERPKFMHQFYLIPLPTGAWGSDDPDAVIAVDQLPCVVGRHPDCDRRVHHPGVSRRHCAFWLQDSRAWVKDLGSRNGTLLNGKPLTRARPLAEGDRLDLAGLPFLCLSRFPDGAGVAFSVARW
jgi:hypothetical protein